MVKIIKDNIIIIEESTFINNTAKSTGGIININTNDIKTLDNGYKISNDDALLNAGCTIQITSIMEVIAKAFTNAR